MFEQSKIAHTKAQQIFPGGVNSPVRAYSKLNHHPIYLEKGQGPWVIDIDGNKYLDFVGAFGPHILGHNPPKLLNKIIEQMQAGLCFGAPHIAETTLGEKIKKHLPSMHKIRLVNSGTEATMTAIRLARAYTKRDKIIKFAGCYHGHHDSFLIEAGSGALTTGIPTSAGLTTNIANNTLIANYNDLSSVIDLFERHHQDIAAVIIEPIAGNMNCILPQTEFLTNLRNLCSENNSLLIFDEVMTGFRVALGGAQTLLQIKPDITTLGKIIGGGFPIGAVGGRTDIIDLLAPLGPVYQAGTLSGHPISTTAGLNTLNALEKENIYPQLNEATTYLTTELKKTAADFNINLQTTAIGGMFGLFLNYAKSPNTYLEVTNNVDFELFQKFHYACLQNGLYFAPSPFEAAFISTTHDSRIIEIALNKFYKVFKNISRD